MSFYDDVLKAMTDEIVKCDLSQKQIRMAIEPMVKSISDSDEEYETLMGLIPREYQRRYKINGNGRNELIVRDMYGAFIRIKNCGGFYVLPNGQDLVEQADLNLKYDMTIDRDCFTIVKNNQSAMTRETTDERYTASTRLGSSTNVVEHTLEEEFDLESETNGSAKVTKDFEDGKITIEQWESKQQKLFNTEAHKKGERMTGVLNESFLDNDVPFESHFGRIG